MYSLPGSKQRILLPQRHKTICFKPEIQEIQKLKHSKALHPFHQKYKPISSKCLEYVLSTSSSESEGECENNKSCHCRDCGHQSKKMKHMKKKYRRFSPVMHERIRERRNKLKQKFKNAVYVIMWMQKLVIQRKKKPIIIKKIVRMKTKFFEAPPEPPQKDQQIIYLEPIQPVQVQMIDFRHKQRQSIVNYLNNKLHDQEHHSNNYQLSLPKVRHQNNLSSSHSRLLLKPLKTQNDEILTPQRNNLHSIIHKATPPQQSSSSPYLKQPPLTTRIRSLQNRLYLPGKY
ncbi:unnamed protein product [Paramecium pentaurelia]|uniref:Uncharacterized protein n=1 Tax=Paramecium pentaurelia TaxID=43138 RepID=A0A8S1WQY4_9CILI|nr:unnamed protein product [Paramecium pentaurelia]